MDPQIIATLIAGLLLLVAVIGTVYPVLPGSFLAIGTLLAWAWFIGSPAAWVFAGIGMAVAITGATASTVLTGRKLKKQSIPKGSILVAVVCAVAGMFVVPVIGLFLGFGLGLFGSELLRRRDVPEATRSSVAVLKSTGLGILTEFGCAAFASSLWMIGVIVHFSTR
ncbi:DUF456 domain-containing protein [Paeniglutamicibacter cryotolerans]|uniref:DUF456 domain-containing protein n=1 Tax=Paeniglutamicibacter cryotolerans TaxID=670079 RepID=A0A839QIQ6_9MICC|nr:DUF456 domain-containing protein [Paeniglutamicibacter cryotolerans]MBB2994624.1 hypothetical protein [Paeniglutamicibacter cryotolerans]